MDLFAKIVENENLLTICAKVSLLDVWQDFECAFKSASAVKNVSVLNRFEYHR